MLGVIVLVLVFVTGAVISIGVVTAQLRAKLRAFEILKVYAERGEEPPAGVVEAVNQVGRPPPPPARGPQTRGQHLSHVAGSVVLAIGAAGIAWWRIQLGDTGPLAIIAIIAAVFFTGAAAARLVAALTTHDGRG